MQDDPQLLQRHDLAASQGAEALGQGRFATALDLFDESLLCAEQLDLPNKIAAARLNISLCYLKLGDWPRARNGMAELVLSSSNRLFAAMAARRVAESWMKEGHLGKSAHYLKIALDHARRCEDRIPEATVQALAGQHAILSGDHESAVACFEQSAALIATFESPRPLMLAEVLDNLGYARLLVNDLIAGIKALHQAVRLARSLGADFVEAEVHVDLAFGFLLAKKHAAAERHALRSLAMATSNGHSKLVKNAVFILMELALRGGRDNDFERYFARLQQLLPDTKLSPDFFRIFDISDVINLKEF